MTISRRISRAAAILAVAALGGAAVPAALASGGAHAATSPTVTLKNMRFNPSTIRVSRGATVTWVWRDGGVKHNVTGRGFRSRLVSKGTFKHRFTSRGTFRYRCTIHPGMDGKVIVR